MTINDWIIIAIVTIGVLYLMVRVVTYGVVKSYFEARYSVLKKIIKTNKTNKGE